MIVTFYGQTEIEDRQAVTTWLYETTERLLTQGVRHFYLGGFGSFDYLVETVLLQHKKTFPKLKLFLVASPHQQHLLGKDYDQVLYPPMNQDIPLTMVDKYRFMIEQADLLVVYCCNCPLPSFDAIACAKQLHKTVCCYPHSPS